MAFTELPQLVPGQKPEAVLHVAVVTGVDHILHDLVKSGEIDNFALLSEFGVDVAVFLKKNNCYQVRFLELKAYAGKRQNGVGFGNGKGNGCQVDLLMFGDNKICFADEFVRWLIWDATSDGYDRYALLTSAQAKSCVMGDSVARGKQNNFNVNRVFEISQLSWKELFENLTDFLRDTFESHKTPANTNQLSLKGQKCRA